jgi:hypothetical protein
MDTDPDPAKNFGSLQIRIRIHSTAVLCKTRRFNYLGDENKKEFKIKSIRVLQFISTKV